MLHLFSQPITTKYNQSQPNKHTLFPRSCIFECKYNELQLYTNKWCMYTMLHLFLQPITTKYIHSQPNTPTLVSCEVVFFSVNTKYYTNEI